MMIKTTREIVKGSVISTRIDDKNNILDYHLVEPNKEWVDKEELIFWLINNSDFENDSFIVTSHLLKVLREGYGK